jgi:hypothetical protein
MKKKKLSAEYEYNFDLFGITSSVKAHRLAWELNALLKIRLVRTVDLLLSYKSGEDKTFIVFEYETQLNVVRLFRNKPNEMPSDPTKYCLATENAHFDYILLVQSSENDFGNNLPETLKKINCIEYVAALPIEGMKSKENFIF